MDATTGSESSSLGDTPCGTVWRKVDLHLHSPGVWSFRCPNGADLQTEAGRQKIIEAYVSQMHAAKIDIGAITDYNGIRSEWFIPIRDQARNYGITVFPGAEVSFSAVRGLHVLAIFDKTTDINQVNSFLLAPDRDGAKPLFTPDRKHRDIDPKDNMADTLKRLCVRFGCLLVFPHPDQPNGVYKGFQPVEAAKLLKEISPDALEHCPSVEATQAMIELGALRISIRRPCALIGLTRTACYAAPATASAFKLQLMCLIDEPYTKTACDGWPWVAAYCDGWACRSPTHASSG